MDEVYTMAHERFAMRCRSGVDAATVSSGASPVAAYTPLLHCDARPHRHSTTLTAGRSASMRMNHSIAAAISFTPTGSAT